MTYLQRTTAPGSQNRYPGETVSLANRGQRRTRLSPGGAAALCQSAGRRPPKRWQPRRRHAAPPPPGSRQAHLRSVAGPQRRRLQTGLFSGLLLMALAVAAALGPLAEGRGSAAPAAAPHAPGSAKLWVVSTRESPCSLPPQIDVAALKYWSYRPETGWADSTLDELVGSTDPRQVTVFWVHGNRVNVEDVMPQAVALLKRLESWSSVADGFRLVVWSWPSGRIPGPLADVRIKAERSECQSVYLADVVARLPSAAPVSLIGFSYGARLIAGSLHLLGGGELDRATLRTPTGVRHQGPRRVVLLAAALDSDWMLPGRRYGHALLGAEQVLVVANPLDPILRLYPWLYPGRYNPQALGAVGLPAVWQLSDPQQVYQIDASRVLGRVHGFRYFLQSPPVLARVVPFALFETPHAGAVPPAAPWQQAAGLSPSGRSGQGT